MSNISLLSVLELPGKKTWNRRWPLETLANCYNMRLYTDAEIRVQNRTFRAHKNILSFYSPLFQKAFYGMKTPSSLCVMNDIKPEGFDLLLRFLYSSEISKEADSMDVVQACYAAQMLGMDGIQEKLENYIFSNTKPSKFSKPIAEEKFWALLQKSHSLKLRELEEKLLEFAEKHFETILKNKDFAKADSQIIKLVLQKKTFDIPESEILERIAYWKDSNSNLDSLAISVRELLVHVDFERLTPAEFYIIVSKYGNIMSGKDSLDILMHLVDPKVCSFPAWYYVGDKRDNILVDLSLNQETANSGDCSRIDKFKSLEDLRKISNLASVSDWERRKKVFQSQEDLRGSAVTKNLDKLNRWKTGRLAKPYEKTLLESFYQMFEEGLFTDVTICAKDGTKIQAHRLILALGSEVFANMLYGTPPLKVLRLEETVDELKIMLRYFYGHSETIPLKSVPLLLDSILSKIDLALKYRCRPLFQVCSNVLHLTTLDPWAVWKLLDRVNQPVNYKVNTKMLLKYAMMSTKKLLGHEGFYKASKNCLVQILKSDFLNMLECDILEYVARWLEIKAKDFPTDRSRMELFKHIRFEALNADQLFAFLKLHDDLLPKNDSLTILTYLFKDSKENHLPTWCYSGPLRSFCYDASTKIGTDIPIPWITKPQKGAKLFRCSYTIAISNNLKESQIQYLELSWKICSKKHIIDKCSITINPDDGTEPLFFDDLDVTPYQRIMVPVFFTLNDKKPKIKCNIEVKTISCHRCYFIKKPKMTFDNVTFEAVTMKHCVSDAIVDNCTSEQIPIPKYMLSKNVSNTAVPTEKMFQTNY